MSKFLVETVFKILGGASRGFNQGRIDTRAAEARAAEIAAASEFTKSEREATQTFEKGETKKSQTFELKVNRINQGYAKINALQAQIYATTNIQEKAKLTKELEEEKFINLTAIKGIEAEYGEDLEDIKQKWQTKEREEGEKFLKWKTEEEITSREKIASEKNINTLEVENLKKSITDAGNTVHYLMNNEGQSMNYDQSEGSGWYGDMEGEPIPSSSSNGVEFIRYNDNELKKNSFAYYENHYQTWSSAIQIGKTKLLFKELAQKGDIPNINRMLNVMKADIGGYKRALVKQSRSDSQFFEAGAEQPKVNIPISTINTLLSAFEDEDIMDNDNINDIVAQELRSVFQGTGEGDASRDTNILKVIKNMGYTQNSDNALDVSRKPPQVIANNTNETTAFPSV